MIFFTFITKYNNAQSLKNGNTLKWFNQNLILFFARCHLLTLSKIPRLKNYSVNAELLRRYLFNSLLAVQLIFWYKLFVMGVIHVVYPERWIIIFKCQRGLKQFLVAIIQEKLLTDSKFEHFPQVKTTFQNLRNKLKQIRFL